MAVRRREQKAERNASEESPRYIELRGVRVNNLKNVDLKFPAGRLIVVTGLSGSGKSSLVFDTLYAEGQRRYVESLSSYARQFLGRMSKPEVDFISGLAPAIAIEQKSLSKNPRSTVGTVTEVYEYLKMLFARIGHLYSPVSGREVKRHSVSHVADFICGLSDGMRIYVLSPLRSAVAGEKPGETRGKRAVEENDGTEGAAFYRQETERLQKMGFSRLFAYGGAGICEMSAIPPADYTHLGENYGLLVDRFVVHPEEKSFYSRVFDSVQTAFNEGDGRCRIVCEEVDADGERKRRLWSFSNRLEADGMTFVKPSPNFFAFNNPYGACKTCGGTGQIVGESEDLVIPDPSLSVYENAVACWRGSKMSAWKDAFIRNAAVYGFPIHRPYAELDHAQKELLWKGGKGVKGISDWFKFMDSQAYKVQYRVLSARYRGRTRCPECEGSRLRADAAYVKVGGKSIQDLVEMPVSELYDFFEHLSLNSHEKTVAARMLTEIRQRLSYLLQVGVPYLTLNRASGTLSGGEAQRIHLANALGSSLVGSMYILDEPSIGLHPRDTQRLIDVVLQLRDLGNTVIVVEHDEEMMRAADLIVDVGPLAGREGGEIVFVGTPAEMIKSGQSLTARYLRNELQIPVPFSRRSWSHYIEIVGARENNLKNLTVKFPLQVLTVVSGVSGSGKSTLVKQTLYPALNRVLGGSGDAAGRYDALQGAVGCLGGVELVDQEPIGRSTRSNPVTYIKAFDDIRNLYAALPLAKERHYAPGYFSFNAEGGRCETCQGEGRVKVEMQFMADIYLLCDECHGKRYKSEVLEVLYRGKSITDILEMTVDEAVAFFEADEGNRYAAAALEKIRTLQTVGLGYLHLGQSSSDLSGGEAQRIKLAYFLRKGASDKPTFFIFDEPTTGLHFHDIDKLRTAFEALLRAGHTIVVVEHHPDVIKLADWVIDMGPEGGREGGRILFEGVPEDLPACKCSYTAPYLKEKLDVGQDVGQDVAPKTKKKHGSKK